MKDITELDFLRRLAMCSDEKQLRMVIKYRIKELERGE